jgi:hypothetical protein
MLKSFLNKVGIVSCLLMTTVFSAEDKKELHVLKSINGYPLEVLKKAGAVWSSDLIEDTNCIMFHVDEIGILKVKHATATSDVKANKEWFEKELKGGRLIAPSLTMNCKEDLISNGIFEGKEELTLSSGTRIVGEGMSLYKSQGPISLSSPLFMFSKLTLMLTQKQQS